MKFYPIILFLALTFIPQSAQALKPLATHDIQRAVKFCNENKGFLDFRHRGRYDGGPIISATCHYPGGLKVFYALEQHEIYNNMLSRDAYCKSLGNYVPENKSDGKFICVPRKRRDEYTSPAETIQNWLK